MDKSKILTPVLNSMAEGYRKQLIKYKAMLKLAVKQKECVEKGEMDKLEGIIAVRQNIITELEKMNNQLRPLRDDIMSTLDLKEFSSTALMKVLPIEATQKIADVLAEIGAILSAIKEMDAINEKLLRQKLAQMKIDLNGPYVNNQVTKAYRCAGKNQSGKFWDKSK